MWSIYIWIHVCIFDVRLKKKNIIKRRYGNYSEWYYTMVIIMEPVTIWYYDNMIFAIERIFVDIDTSVFTVQVSIVIVIVCYSDSESRHI